MIVQQDSNFIVADSRGSPGDLLVFGDVSLDPDGGGIVRRRSAAANVSGVLTSCHTGVCEAPARWKSPGKPRGAGLSSGEAAAANLLNSLHGACK